MSYSVKPGRGPSLMGGILALVIGVPFLIFWTTTAPSEMKVFGVLGLFLAIGGAVYNFYNAGARERISEHDIVSTNGEDKTQNVGTGADTAARLQELASLRAKGLITEAELEEKRASIISAL